MTEKLKEVKNLIDIFEFLIGLADNKTLMEMKELLDKEIHLSNTAIKEGLEEDK